MKKLTFMLFFVHVIIFAQEKYDFIPTDLHQMTDKELRDNEVQISEETPMFDVDGLTIEQSQINSLMTSTTFVPVIYGDANHKAKLVVFRKITKKEKAAATHNVSNPNANFIVGQKAVDFTVYDIENAKLSLNDLNTKIVVLTFWFPECKPCTTQISALNKLAHKYKGKVHFISITFDSKDSVKSFLSRQKFDYKHITDNEFILEDYNVTSFPTNIIIDKGGEIILRKIGDFTNEMDIKIGLLLKK